MSIALQGLNSSPTKRETDRLRYFIKTRETELKSVKKELSDEKKQLDTCDKAISNLELTIPEAKQVLKANEDSLASLINIQTQLNTVGRIQEKVLKSEPVTKTLYSEFRSYAKKPHERLSEHIDEQIDGMKKDIRVLWDKVRELEMELGGWKASKRLFQRAITRLNASRSDIEADIKTGNEAFRPIWSIPSDVWVKILEHAIEEEKASYLKNNQSNKGLRPPQLKLSQVCQQWRYLVNSEPALRTLVYVAPSGVWRQDEYDLVLASVEKANTPVTILTNLWHPFVSGYQYNVRYDQNGNVASYLSPNENTVFNGKEYTLLVDMYDDNSSYMQRLSYVPLRRPTSLIFSARSNIRYNHIHNYLGNFSAVKSFSIINDNPSTFPNISLSSYLPQLQKFILHVKTFPPNLQLANFLLNTLHELYLRNDGGGTLPNVSNFELPQLRVLGITSPGSYLLDKLTARGLKTLTFYGPQVYSGAQFTASAKANIIYNQLYHLKFEDWKTPSISNASFGAVSVFRNLSTKISALQTVTFVNSHVDGGDLVSIAATMVAPSGQSANLKKLEEIKLSYPIGITNDQCEELKKLVKRVKIYM